MGKMSSDAQMRRCTKNYQALKDRLHDVGFICTGSLVERWMPCGKPSCQCASDDTKKHGPYYQLSWKEGGKTVSQRLSPEHAALYRQWIANRHRLESIVSKMHAISLKAQRHLLASPSSAKKRR